MDPRARAVALTPQVTGRGLVEAQVRGKEVKLLEARRALSIIIVKMFTKHSACAAASTPEQQIEVGIIGRRNLMCWATPYRPTDWLVKCSIIALSGFRV